MNDRKLTRRNLLKGAAAGAIAAPWLIPSSALGDDTNAAASERVTLGHIGVGGRGGGLLGGFIHCKDSQSVAVSDCYTDRRKGRAKFVKGDAYADFRDLLARDDIDAVVVATPDHWHVPIANAAARAGKDAYVEKPLGVSLGEILTCRQTFRENQRIFQYGTQQRSSAHCRFGCELVRSGRIGKVHTIEVIAPDGNKGGSTDVIPVPDNLDYDMWCGPSPVAPYSAGRCSPPGTYWIYDYSIGYLGGWGAHPLDIMVWGSLDDISGTMELEGTGIIGTDGLYDTVYHWDIQGTFGNGVKFTFKPGGDSTKFIGDEGWVRIWRGGIDAEPKSLLQEKIGPDDVHLIESPRQDQNFIDSIKSRQPAISNIEDSVRSDIISQLCNILVRTGRKITWDAEKEVIVGDEEATKMMHRPMREPWTL